MISLGSSHNQRILITGFIAFALVCLLLLLPGCAGENAAQTPTEETTATEEKAEPAATEPTEESVEGQIRVSDHYYYMLPEGFQEIEAAGEGEFANLKRFVSDDGVHRIRSFEDKQVNYPFPEIVEAVFEGKEADIEYQDFIFDEPIFRVKHLEKDEKGNRMHVTSLVWMDGTDDLCWIDIISSKEDQTEIEEQIFDTIGLYGSADDYVAIPDQNPPAYEKPDLDEIMMKEAEEAMKKEYEKEMKEELEYDVYKQRQ